MSFRSRLFFALLAGYGISAQGRPGAPGVYVAGEKIASLGLRVRDVMQSKVAVLRANSSLREAASALMHGATAPSTSRRARRNTSRTPVIQT